MFTLPNLKMYSILLLFFFSCGEDENTKPTGDTGQSQLIIFGEDISKTFRHHERLAPDELLRFCLDLLAENVFVSIYTGPIGNPNFKPFLSCKIRPLPKLNENANLITQNRQAAKAEAIYLQNKVNIENFIREYTAQIYEVAREENTDIAGYFEKAEHIFKEPQYTGFQKTIFLHSDGIHDIGGKKDMLPLGQENYKDILFYVSGLKNKKIFENVNIIFLEGPRAFFENFPLTIKLAHHENSNQAWPSRQ